MVQYIIRRLINIVPVFLGITVISFIVIHLAPGKPTDLMVELNPKASLEAREKLVRIYGLDKPLHVQYINWLKRILKFDFGRSFTDNRPVLEKIRERLPITIFINILSMCLIFALAIPIGVKGALSQGSGFDKASTALIFAGFAMPGFWLGLLLMSLFGVQMGIVPVSGLTSLDFENLSFFGKILDVAHHLVLPLFVASIGGVAGISRYMRQGMISVLREDFVRQARAKGLSEFSVVYKHALRNALLPIITIVGLSIPGLISGSVIFESIFNIPGMGRLMVEATFTRDYNVIMAGLFFSACLTLLGNLFSDICYFYADPRIRVKGK